MNEDDARNALLVRAVETTTPVQLAWTDDDRAWASRAAAEVEGENASAQAFVARRARLAVERLSAREAGVRRTLAALAWRPWVGWLLAAAAFVTGAAGDAIGTGRHVNVLAPPLLALIAWNLLAYVLITARALAAALGSQRTSPGPLARTLARAARAGTTSRHDARSTPALARFAVEWARASARLNAARIARVLHVAAIAIALGALAGLYTRGLGLEYRAGWESTFLDAGTVSRMLAVVLAPASWLTGLALPDAARLDAMRFPTSSGEPAGPWIHLYAVTVALFVLLPRLALAALARLRERRLATRVPVTLDDAYFAALARAHRGEAASVLVVPYSHALAPQAAFGLRAILAPVLGAGTRLAVAATVVYGDEESAAAALGAHPPPTLVIALLSSAATPEAEAHGAFVDTLAAALPSGAGLLVLIDESAFVERFGETDPTAIRRREERQTTWRRFFSARARPPLIIDLSHAHSPDGEHALREALDRVTGAAVAGPVT
ncbi:MAG: DUF2868 domain-containing protein [Burkholderiaceae bacterium]|nr:DUF2868 domain-containing protein [Burkholderiaceae bacterium]